MKINPNSKHTKSVSETKSRNNKTIRIYPSITTTKNVWREQINEINKLNIKTVCLFPTGINHLKRKKLYKLLESSCVTKIPFVHIRNDMDKQEIKYLIQNYNTKLFNIHSQSNGFFPLKHDLSEYKKIIYIETTLAPIPDKELNKYAGICLDTTHVENQRIQKNKLYTRFLKSFEKYPIGIAHISAIKNTPITKKGNAHFDKHMFSNLSEFDYVENYIKFLPKTVALELENSIIEQLQAKTYIEKIVKNHFQQM